MQKFGIIQHMNDILQADIFFFIASVALTITSLLFVIALIYLIKFLREAKHVMDIIQYEAELLSDDMNMLREKVYEGDFSIGSIFSMISKFRKKKGRKKLK